MSKMIYRPQTKEPKFLNRRIAKVVFLEAPLDGLSVEMEEAAELCTQGWFMTPEEIASPKPKKTTKAKRNVKAD